MWQEILTSILTSGVITGIFLVILNKAIENKFDMKLEAYKDKLKFESDRELLQLTKDLELKASEREIKFGGVFPSQREIIENTYAKFMVIYDALIAFGRGLFADNVEEKARILTDAYKELCLYYYPKAIYLPERTVKSVGSLTLACEVLARNYKEIHRINTLEKAQRDALQATLNELYAKCPELEKAFGDCHLAVIHEFQVVLGIKPDKAAENNPKIN